MSKFLPKTKKKSVTLPEKENTPLPDPRMQGSMKSLYEDIKKNKSAPEGYHKAGTYASDYKPIIEPTVREKVQATIDQANLKKQMETEQATPNVSQEQLSQLGQLTPEQQAVANSNSKLAGKFNLGAVGAAVAERASIGAVTGAVGGAGIGALAGGVGAVPGAVAGGIGGAAVGTISAFFTGFKDVNYDNIAGIDSNVANAKWKINNAASIALKGASYEDVKKEVGDSIAQLDLAERQYKRASKNVYAERTHTMQKMEDIIKYRRDILPDKILRVELALQRPNPSGIDNGVDEVGVTYG